MTKLTDARQLDWSAVNQAADAVKRICADAGFVAPEYLARQRELIVLVCQQLDVITKALLITRGAS